MATRVWKVRRKVIAPPPTFFHFLLASLLLSSLLSASSFSVHICTVLGCLLSLTVSHIWAGLGFLAFYFFFSLEKIIESLALIDTPLQQSLRRLPLFIRISCTITTISNKLYSLGGALSLCLSVCLSVRLSAFYTWDFFFSFLFIACVLGVYHIIGGLAACILPAGPVSNKISCECVSIVNKMLF